MDREKGECVEVLEARPFDCYPERDEGVIYRASPISVGWILAGAADLKMG